MNINAGEKTTRHTNELRNERFTFIQRKTNKHNKRSTRKFIFFWGGGECKTVCGGVCAPKATSLWSPWAAWRSVSLWKCDLHKHHRQRQDYTAAESYLRPTLRSEINPFICSRVKLSSSWYVCCTIFVLWCDKSSIKSALRWPLLAKIRYCNNITSCYIILSSCPSEF